MTRVVVELDARILVAGCSRKSSNATKVNQPRLHSLAAKSADWHRWTRSHAVCSFSFQLEHLNT